MEFIEMVFILHTLLREQVSFSAMFEFTRGDKCIRATIRKIYSIRMRRSGQPGEARALQSPSYVSHYVTLVMGRQPDSK